jgi:hypothetical protein
VTIQRLVDGGDTNGAVKWLINKALKGQLLRRAHFKKGAVLSILPSVEGDHSTAI